MNDDDVIDYAAGIMFDRKTGDQVKAGETIARIQLGAPGRDPQELRKRYLSFIHFGDAPPETRALVHEHLK